MKTYSFVMNDLDSQLRRLMQQWRDLEPRPMFAADVRRRIRLETVRPASRWAWLIPQWQPIAAAAVIALMIGAWAGRQAPPAFAAPPTTFLAADSLAGGYLKLTGAHR